MTGFNYTVTPGPATAIGTGPALQAYRQTEALAGDAASGFGAALSQAVDGAIAAGHAADTSARAAIEGHGSLTEVVTAMSKAELALQTTAALRDRMVQAYQDIMRMPI